jgi:hypothetical protein
MNTIQETPQDYTFMKAVGFSIQLTAELERLGDRHQPIRFFFGGRLMEVVVRDVDDEPLDGTDIKEPDCILEDRACRGLSDANEVW